MSKVNLEIINGTSFGGKHYERGEKVVVNESLARVLLAGNKATPIDPPTQKSVGGGKTEVADGATGAETPEQPILPPEPEPKPEPEPVQAVLEQFGDPSHLDKLDDPNKGSGKGKGKGK